MIGIRIHPDWIDIYKDKDWKGKRKFDTRLINLNLIKSLLEIYLFINNKMK